MSTFDPYPLFLLALGIGIIFVLILRFKFNAFLALLLAALSVGFLSRQVVVTQDGQLNLVNAPRQVALAFGSLMGNIGIAIALATIVGKALMESGAADRIVRAFVRLFGERFASLALMVSGFVLAIPVFFDTVFLLLVPLAKALRLRTGKNYLLYVTAIGAGGAITHSLVPPTPGPIAMAETLKVDMGMTIIVGILVGFPLSLIGFAWGGIANRLWPTPLRQTAGASAEELEKRALRPDHELPGLFISLLPILLPVVLITSLTVFQSLERIYPGINRPLLETAEVRVTPKGLLEFFGNSNIALLLAALVSMGLVARRLGLSRKDLGQFTSSALDEAGMILLITCAGGAFGRMLQLVGVGDSINALSKELGLSILVLAWAIAALFKIAQGSGTVSMITTSGIVFGIVTSELGTTVPTTESLAAHLGYHPVYLVMAIGTGSKIGSWMNDSGFWVVCKMGGLTEGETFKSWTLCLVIMGFAGLPVVWILTKLLPLT